MIRYAIRVDPIACDGHGLCAELLPERISLDDWGFPIVDDTPIGDARLGDARLGDARLDDARLEDARLEDARRTVSNCPALALRLERILRAEERGGA